MPQRARGSGGRIRFSSHAGTAETDAQTTAVASLMRSTDNPARRARSFTHDSLDTSTTCRYDSSAATYSERALTTDQPPSRESAAALYLSRSASSARSRAPMFGA